MRVSHEGDAMQAKMTDERCWRFRRAADGGVEKRIFVSPRDVPMNDGWADSPVRIDEASAKASLDRAQAAVEAANAELAEAVAADEKPRKAGRPPKQKA